MIIAGLCLIPAYFFNDNKAYGKSTTCVLFSLVMLTVVFWQGIVQLAESIGVVRAAVYCVSIYVICGLFVGLLYWISMNVVARERFDELFEKFKMPEKFEFLKAQDRNVIARFGVCQKYRYIYDDLDGYLRFPDITSHYNKINTSDSFNKVFNEHSDPEVIASEIKTIQSQIDMVLPPRFKIAKPFVIGAACSWPITIIHLVFSKLIKQLISRIISASGWLFDVIGKVTFGKF